MKIGIIGFGNLGRSLADGLLKSGFFKNDIYICEKSQIIRKSAEQAHCSMASEDVNLVIKQSDVVFFTVKNFVFTELAEIVDKSLLPGKTFVSFMAGVSFERIYELLGDVSLVRAMPSLAISICDGVIGYTKAPPEVEAIFQKLGYAFETEPENIEKVMAFSSCGLGFAAYLIDAFSVAGQSMGFTPEISDRIAAITFKNAVERGGFKETVKAVATPGGATQEGVSYMDETGVYDIIAGAVAKAYNRMK